MFRRVMHGQTAPQRRSEFIPPPVGEGFSAVDVEIVDHQVDGSGSWIALDKFSDRLSELSGGALPTHPSEVPASLRLYGTENIRGSAALYHLAGAFDQMDDGKQDLSVALAELLDDGGRLPGSASHNMVRFLHGGWLLFGVLFGNRILSKPAPPPPTNLQLSPGHHRVVARRIFLSSSENARKTIRPPRRGLFQQPRSAHQADQQEPQEGLRSSGATGRTTLATLLTLRAEWYLGLNFTQTAEILGY